jgi:quercetin dioxygenase-like cupin family protein
MSVNMAFLNAPLRVVLAVALAAMLAGVFMYSGRAAGQEAPRPPSSRYVSTFSVTAPAPAQYEIVQTILDFAPGAITREHTHGGPEFVTVVEGTLTRIKGGVETTFTAGQSFREEAGGYFAVANRGSAKARAFATILLTPGQPVTINHADHAVPGLLPVTVAFSRTTVVTQPADFDLQQRIIDFGPGAYAGPHRHPGPLLITQLSGEIVSKSGSVEVRQRAGGTYVESAGVTAEHHNPGSETATVAVTFLLPRGAPPAVPVQSPATTAPSISPPNTGDAGIR